MKTRIFIYFSALVLTLSCSEDFLTRLPETVVSLDDFYKTEADFQQAIIGVYSPLRNLYGAGTTEQGAWIMGEMRSDNTTFTYNPQSRAYYDQEHIELLTEDANAPAVSTKYNNDYIIIQRANQIIKYIDEAIFDKSTKNNIKGQALFLRAFAYFDLVQYFGDVPLITVSPSVYEETLQSRTSMDVVYQQIIEDVTLAATLLPSPSNTEKGYVANGAAYTLLGNVYIVLEEWAKAEEALRKVEGYSLLNDYASIFEPSNKNNSESIFEVQYTDDPTANAASHFAYMFLPVLNDPGVIPGFPSSGVNIYAGMNTPTPDLIDSYESGDMRFDASIGFFTGEGYTNNPYVKKYLHGATIAPNTDDNFPVYRYSEVLLFLAEALNEQNKTGEALNYLNQVHAHPRTGLAALNISDQSSLREAIQHERQIELAFENKRWLDLVRTGKAIEVMNAQGVKIKANPQAYYYPEGVSPVSEAYNMNENRLLFAIPQREIRLNPEMTQNKGY